MGKRKEWLNSHREECRTICGTVTIIDDAKSVSSIWSSSKGSPVLVEPGEKQLDRYCPLQNLPNCGSKFYRIFYSFWKMPAL